MDSYFIHRYICPHISELAKQLLDSCNWNWAYNTFSKEQLKDYQLFLLCKVAQDDIVLKHGQTRFSLSPTVDVDEVWHEHMLHPQEYFKMCKVLLKDHEGEDKILHHHTVSVDDPKEAKKRRRRRTKKVLQRYVLRDIEAEKRARKRKIQQLNDNLVQLFVTADMKTKTIECSLLETVLDFKEKIEECHGIPVEEQRLIFQGQQLWDDDKTLEAYNIQKECTVHLSIRLRGC